MWPALFAAAALLAVAVGMLAVWLAAQRSALTAERDRLRDTIAQRDEQLAERDRQLAERDEQVNSRNAEIAALKQEIAVNRETLTQVQKNYEEAQQRARETFKAVANDVLNASSQQFLQLARKTFEGEQKDAILQLEQRKQAIENLVKPVRDTLEKYNASLQQIEKARSQAYGSLLAQITEMQKSQGDLRRETANLVTALRRPEVRGRWGEMQLRRVAELAGMIENCDFTEQTSVRTDEGNTLRPDMVVRMPSNRTVVVDAKTPLDAFINAVDCQDETERQRYLQQHADQIDVQIRRLSSKQYGSQFAASPDFVVLFIPGESFLQAAVQLRPTLLEQAWDKGVLIATPSTLIALLKTVALGWREQRIAENAQRISDLGRELHSRLGTAFGHVVNLGKAVGSTVKHYNSLIGSLERNVLPQARRFQELGADSAKELPAQLDRLENTPTDPTASELTEESAGQ